MADTHQSGMPVSRAIGGKTANSMELPIPTIAKHPNSNLNVGRCEGDGVVGETDGAKSGVVMQLSYRKILAKATVFANKYRRF